MSCFMLRNCVDLMSFDDVRRSKKMEAEGVLIQYESNTDKELYNCSGLMLKQNIVLTTGACLAPFLQKYINTNNNYDKSIDKDLLNKLLKIRIKYEQIQNNNTNHVTPVGRKKNVNIEKINTFEKNVRITNKKRLIAIVENVKILKIFHCAQIDFTIEQSLSEWDVNGMKDYKVEIVKNFLLSIIIILKINHNNNSDINENNILYELSHNLVPVNYLERGDSVYLETTPFGNDTFLNSYSEGIIANTIGKDQCIFLTDASAAPGSEGGPIFLKTKTGTDKHQRIIVGLVFSSVSFWKDEWCGFTLGISLACLMPKILESPKPNDRILFEKPTKSLRPESIDNTILKISCGGSWGTGILINKDKGIIVTAAHTIKNPQLHRIYGKWKKELFKLHLLYKTPDHSPYDIAILQTTSPLLKKMEAIKFATTPPYKGEIVLAFGYPFNIVHCENKNDMPTVSQGFVAKTNQYMLQTTCCIHRGASGGAIVRPNGELLGIIVCITANDETQTSYPHINMAVPAELIRQVLNNYLKNGDVSAFSMLEIYEKNVRHMWNLFKSHL